MINSTLGTPYLYALIKSRGVGIKTAQKIISRINSSPSSIKEFWDILNTIKASDSSITIPTYGEIRENYDEFESSNEILEKEHITTIGIGDENFPDELKSISSPPLILYVKGNIECLNPKKSIAIIGTREPTEYGRESGIRISKYFAERGLIVVSGLAEGCDTAAHEGCLKVGGKTVAVMAHGLQMVYPAKNRNLAIEIVNSGGCLVSEYPLGQKPFKQNFIDRDRLQSGLSSAVLIIETDVKGGTMHTAKFCIEQKRALACLTFPPSRRSEKSRGNEQLVHQGKARSIWEKQEIDDFIKDVYKIDSLPIIDRKESSHSSLNALNTSDKIRLDLDIFIGKEVYKKFTEKCQEEGKNVNSVVASLIENYLYQDDQSKVFSPLEISNSSQEDYIAKINDQLKLFSDNEEVDSSINVQADLRRRLNQSEIAKRLSISPSTVRSHKLKDDFSSWSKERDPEGLAWYFDPSEKIFSTEKNT